MPRAFSERHPYLFVALLEAAVIAVYLLAGLAAHVFQLTSLGLYALANATLSAGTALLLSRLGGWGWVGYRLPRQPSDLGYYLVPFLPLLVNLIPGLAVAGWWPLLAVAAVTLLVSFVEESLYRGLMLAALKPRGLWRAALLTASLFGLTHAMNVLAGKSLLDDLAQITYTMAIGFAYAALVLRKGLLWPLVLAHAVIDLANLLQKPGLVFSPAVNLAVVLGTTVIFTLYGLFVMREVAPA
jgi:membrane protease YdiL (CAAX protease family)